jgi:hypothetical protein
MRDSAEMFMYTYAWVPHDSLVELTPTATSKPVHLAAVPEPLCSHLP